MMKRWPLESGFVKFPSTPHLAVLEGVSVRQDKVFSKSEQDVFLSNKIVVEEKIDGANLGISFDSDGNIKAQNRGSYLSLPSSGQWKPLEKWLEERVEYLFDRLTDQHILFGEWCYATHSVNYGQLPDWFVGFDIFDLSSHRFLNHESRNKFFSQMGIHPVPLVASGKFSLPEAKELLSKSCFGVEPAEGLYFRIDSGDWLGGRAKIVRAHFLQAVKIHWTRQPLRFNRLADVEFD